MQFSKGKKPGYSQALLFKIQAKDEFIICHRMKGSIGSIVMQGLA